MNRDDFTRRAYQQRDLGPMTNFQRIPEGKFRIGLYYSDRELEGLAEHLEACPFDGGEARYCQHTGEIDRGGRKLWIACSKCGASIPGAQTERWKAGYGTFYADDDAVLMLKMEWNRRVAR